MQPTIKAFIAVDARPAERHRFTSMIPAHYSINESLYREGGIYFGSIAPPCGAFLHVPGADSLGTLKDDHLKTSSSGARKFVIITPTTISNGLTLKNFLFPDAATHNFRRSRADETYRISPVSIVMVGDVSIHLIIYCFPTITQSATILRCLTASKAYLSKVWTAIVTTEGPSPLIVTMPRRPEIVASNALDAQSLGEYIILPVPVVALSASVNDLINRTTAAVGDSRANVVDRLIAGLKAEQNKRKRDNAVEDTPLLKFARLACEEGKKNP